MDNAQIADIFSEMADLLEITGSSGFRIRAFRRAAEALAELPEPAASLLQSGALERIPGVGKGTVARVKEILRDGDCADHRQLRQTLPAGLLEMLKVSGLGPKSVGLFYNELGISNLDALEAAARGGDLAHLPRMGEKSQQKIVKAIEAYRRRSAERIPIARARPHALTLLAALREHPAVQRSEITGSLRRCRDTIGDVDLLAAAEDARAVITHFAELPQVAEILARGETKCSVLLPSALQVDLRVVAPQSYGAALHYFTGSQMHNIAIRDRAKRIGLRINEYGVYREPAGDRLCGDSEQEIFAVVNLPFIPPELREDRGEIEAAENNALPQLVEGPDVQGDLQLHSDAAEGSCTIEQLAKAAKARGLRYLAVTDRIGAATPSGEIATRIAQQRHECRRLSDQLDIQLFAGAEVDILPDGRLAADAALLRPLDWVIAAVHSERSQPQAEMTSRLIAAVRSGQVDCIAHPTGRLIGSRPPVAVDVEALLRAAKEQQVAIELNATPQRLDLDATHCRLAAEIGTLVVINSDARSAEAVGVLDYGIATARRGWLGSAQVLNCQPASTVIEHRRRRS